MGELQMYVQILISEFKSIISTLTKYLSHKLLCIDLWLFPQCSLIIYLSSLPVAHLSDAPRRRLVVTGDSARIQDETTENSGWFFNVLGV